MRTILKWTVVIGLSLCPLSAQALAAFCLPHDRMVAELKTTHKENLKYVAIPNSTGVLLEVFISEDGKWTITETNTSKMSCVRRTGTDWMIMPEGKGI